MAFSSVCLFFLFILVSCVLFREGRRGGWRRRVIGRFWGCFRVLTMLKECDSWALLSFYFRGGWRLGKVG